ATDTRVTTLYTISNVTQNRASVDRGIIVARRFDDNIDYFIPVAATPDFAFMLDTGSRNVFPGTYGIQVSGVGAGAVQGSKNITVPEAFGRDPSRTSYPSPTYTYPSQNRDSDSDSTAVIAGVIAGVLVMVMGLVCCLRKRSSKSNDANKQAAQAVPMAQVPGMNGPYQANTAGQPRPVGVYPQTPGQPMYSMPGQPMHPMPGQPIYPMPGQPIYPMPGQPIYPIPGQPMHPMSGQPMHPMPQPAPIAISDAMTITPAAPAVPPLQSGQDQLQHLQFSSHPRPNFVTSVGDDDPSNSQRQEVDSGNNSVTSASPNVSLSASHSPGWEPQPWTPKRPANSNVNTSTTTE
ncbi:hypothetical protein BGX34_005970, partial [Mortierella sp. NVP85]